jgi:hypothetical protein
VSRSVIVGRRVDRSSASTVAVVDDSSSTSIIACGDLSHDNTATRDEGGRVKAGSADRILLVKVERSAETVIRIVDHDVDVGCSSSVDVVDGRNGNSE